jgi:hypothetical protein
MRQRYGADWEAGRRDRSSFRQGGYHRSDGMAGRPWPGRYGADFDPQRQQGYGGDYWWMGERAMPRQGRGRTGYDQGYREFSERNRPRFSPVGGMHNAMGGDYAAGRAPRPLRENTWFSEWTRWF